ncbi:MAG: hypothetical protein V3S28_05720, partial [Acidimicrobiia bacterium]
MHPHGGKKRQSGTFITMEEILDLSLLIKQIALAFGAAMVIGNVFAVIQNKRGKAPKGETGEFRAVRAYWLLGVGALIATWGAVSLLA